MRTLHTAALRALLVVAVAASSGASAEEVPTCVLRLLDDRGQAIAEEVTVCRDRAEDSCFQQIPGQPAEVAVVPHFVEGEGHGPTTAKPETGQDGVCILVVPRKAWVVVSLGEEDPEKPDLEASFYRPGEDPEMFRPALRATVEKHPQEFRVPAGSYLVSLTSRGWAPDLHLLDAAPGSAHTLEYRQRDGWSAVLRTVADRDGRPVGGAEIEIRTLPGFDEPGVAPSAETRSLMKRRTNPTGLAVASGLLVPVAAASLRQEDYLDAELPAFSSDTGTFRVFETRFHEGGSVEALVLREGLPADDARCELAPPGVRREPPWGLYETLHEGEADSSGVCRMKGIPGGLYALKVSLPESSDANTIQPITVRDGEVSDATVDLWPWKVSGRVLKGEQGAAGYKVEFQRSGFETAAGYYPGGQSLTDDDGRYEIVLWSAGRYLAQVSTESTTAGNFKLVDVDADRTIDFRIAVAELEGQVVNEAGAPVPEARISVKGSMLQRGVIPDEEGRFRISFRDEDGAFEIRANADGYHKAEPKTITIARDQQPEPVILVLRRRLTRTVEVVLPSGRPAVGVSVSSHRLAPSRYSDPIERWVTGADGRAEIPRASEPLRLFYGGPGCALGSYDLAPASSDVEPSFEIRCEPPSHLIVRLLAEDPALRSGAPILLRHGHVVIPLGVLEHHLTSLGLPPTTDGQGQIGLVALASGTYDIFHGMGTSERNLLDGYEAAKLATTRLGTNSTVEIEVSVQFEPSRMDQELLFSLEP